MLIIFSPFLSYMVQPQLRAGCDGPDREQFVSRDLAWARKRHMAPVAELVNDLIRSNARCGDRTANFQRRTECGAEDIRRQTLDMHGILRSADHLIQPGGAVSTRDVDGLVSQCPSHEFQTLRQSRKITDHFGRWRVVDTCTRCDLRGGWALQRKMGWKHHFEFPFLTVLRRG